MSKEQALVFTGIVLQELGNSMFRVDLENIESLPIICTISGKIRKNYIRILAGDRVRIEISPYDLTRGRIVTRLKNEDPEETNNKPNNKPKNKKR